METDIFDSILEKKFEDLSSAEKLEMKDLFTNKEEFTQLVFALKSFGENQNNEKPSTKVKADLDHLYNQTYSNKGILWYNSLALFFVNKEKNWYQQNLSKIAAIFLLGLLLYPIVTTSPLKDSKKLTASHKQEEKAKVESYDEKETIIETKEANSEIAKDKVESNPILPARELDAKKAFVTKSKISVIDDVLEESKSRASAVMVSAAEMSIHPDGVFVGADANDKNISNASKTFALSSNLELLDLLTATY